jgi:hypothetical protein
MVRVPVLARELAVSLRVEDPEPGAAMDVGVKLAVTPDGMPLAVKAIADAKPFRAAVVTVDVPELLRVTVTVVGDALILKSAPAGAVTVRLTVVEFTMPPPVPVTVIGYVPIAVLESTVKVRTELPLPGALMGLVPKPADAPVGKPDADKVMAALKPFTTAVVIVDVPVLPWATETEVGEAEMLKLGAVTVSVTVVLFTVLPEVPVTVIGYVPVAVFEATVKVSSDVPLPGAEMGLVPKPAVTPVGRADADKVMAPLKPFKAAVVIVDVPLLPWITVIEVGEADMLKLGPADPASALIKPNPFILPQPVTRS